VRDAIGRRERAAGLETRFDLLAIAAL